MRCDLKSHSTKLVISSSIEIALDTLHTSGTYSREDLMMRQSYDIVKPYITKDGSEIRELMHPSVHGNQNQSLAQATIPIGGITHRHKHLITEELYHVTQGHGLMYLGDQMLNVFPGDTVCIRPGTEHCIENRGKEPLVLLCCCSPAYTHDDTVLVE